MNIFFDLDGTLCESKYRLYQLFTDLTGAERLSLDEYWRLKRAMFGHEWMLNHIYNFSTAQTERFTKQWMQQIEAPNYLQYDELFEFTHSTLSLLSKHDLYIVTSRQKKNETDAEIHKLGIRNFFKKILVTEQKFEKDELILKSAIQLSPDDLFVGDTGIDIKAGKKLGIKTIAVLSGFRNYESLEKYQPNYLIKGINLLPEILEKLN